MTIMAGWAGVGRKEEMSLSVPGHDPVVAASGGDIYRNAVP